MPRELLGVIATSKYYVNDILDLEVKYVIPVSSTPKGLKRRLRLPLCFALRKSVLCALSDNSKSKM